jgi:hypothetical protein
VKYQEFSRIAEEEASRASRADGVEYVCRTAAADGGKRTDISIHVLHPQSGESLVLLDTPREPADLPALASLTETAARGLVQQLLSTARANRTAELYLDDFLHSLRGSRGGEAR